MCQEFVWLIIFAASWGKLKVIPFIIKPNGDIFLFKKKKGLLVIYIQLLRWNRKCDLRKQLRVCANIHTLTVTCGKSRKSVSLKRSDEPIYAAFEPCFHTTLNPSYETSPALFWSVTLCRALRWHVSLLLWNPIFHQHSILSFDDTLLIFIVVPETFLSYTMYL